MSDKLYEVLKRASLFLEEHHREPGVAEILLQHHLNVSRSQFYMMMQDSIPQETIANFEKDIEKHAETGIPVQHLTGYEEFYGREFAVNEHVLIPRPETEELVLHVINQVKNQTVTIADIGTGSGIIAATLALELPEAAVYASDISEAALATARENAEKLDADVTFLQGNFLKPFIQGNIQVDVIVSNPPYIARAEEELLSDTVKNFDPELALFADEEGLAAYREIIQQAKVLPHLEMIVFEIGHTQGEALHQLIRKTFPTARIQTIQDINKKDRIVSAKL
ncbi:peptide chain release factor N(5)-glutamine methyltransferase [Oceanobacillus halophilus]|uniref:Release factor glutamine methyltransferase n=1 Tax=Oceanobacillus halophilus TaxID=930130 RepID=A0A495A4S3_9BACI|nr:peptide chain release factor N(5)-glutamine methyltransferase [Oceanobacillus halophilus]RKQ34402.1 peptide chain release factor N(5)-glutamine methyltransferase [Oceanobacillus halophilus]